MLWVQNIGTDTAHGVELTIDHAGKSYRESQTMALISPREKLGVGLVPWHNEADAEWHELMSGPGTTIASPGYSARARLTWRSAEGVPGVKEWPDLRL